MKQLTNEGRIHVSTCSGPDLQFASLYLFANALRHSLHTCKQVFLKAWPCWPLRRFERPHIIYPNAEMVVKQGLSVFWLQS